MNPAQMFIAAAGLLYLGVVVTAGLDGKWTIAGVHAGYALANVFMFFAAGE